MIDGKSAQSLDWVDYDTYEWTTLAKEVGAIVFLLEHRFYGKSQPTGDLSFSSLKYLTSQQALADVNNFINGMNAKFNITNPRWITFGGTYGGALSAWARQIYPKNVFAAVASSAPVQAVVDMTGFLDTVYHALNNYQPECAASLNRGLLKVNELIKTASGRSTLQSTFDLCNSLATDADTIAFFYQTIISNYMNIVLYSEDNISTYAVEMTIPRLCAQQTSTSDGLQGMSNVNGWIINYYGGFCLDMNYSAYINYLKDTKAGGDFRSWLWQKCNEFGFFPSTDSSLVISNMTGQVVIPINYYVKQCAEIFDSSYDNSTIYSKIDATNAYYKGQKGYSGKRVVFPNGSNDPWHVLSVLTATNTLNYPIVIDGTGNSADMYAPKANDKPGLIRARAAIRTHVLTWVNQ